MSGIYGSWLDGEDERFKSRTLALTDLALKTRDSISQEFPEASKFVKISFTNLNIAVGRYINDLVRYKEFHKIDTLHPSKVVAHTIKWVALNPVLFTDIKVENLKSLNQNAQSALLNLNFIYIMQIVEYFLKPINPYISEQMYDHIYSHLNYYLKTANYNERMASLWFEQLMRT